MHCSKAINSLLMHLAACWGRLFFTEKIVLVFIICLGPPLAEHIAAQQIFQPGRKLPLMVIRCPDKQTLSAVHGVEHLTPEQKAQYHFWVFSEDNTAFEVQFNDLLNGPEGIYIDMQRIYLLEATTALRTASPYLSERIFAGIFTLNIADDPAAAAIGKLITTIDKYKHALWEVELANLQMQNREAIYNKRKLFIGLTLGQSFQRIQTADTAYLPGQVTNYGITVGGNFHKSIQLLTRLAFSFKRPDQSALQSSIFSQIDIAAGGEQTISAEMKLHFIGQAAVQLNYMFRPEHRFRPYIGAGLSLNFYTAAKIEIEQKIDVADLMGGGGPPNADALGLDPTDDLPLFSRRFMTPQFSTGFNHALNKHVMFTFSANYQLPHKATSMDDGMEYREQMYGFSVNCGLQYNFGNTRYYYHYLKKRVQLP